MLCIATHEMHLSWTEHTFTNLFLEQNALEVPTGTIVKYVKPTFLADDTNIFICENNINAVQDNVDTTVKQLLRWFEKIDY